MDESELPGRAPESQPGTTCPRCGRENPVTADRCRFCSAPLPGRVPRPRVIRADHVPESTHRGVTWLFGIFSLQLLTNVGIFWFLRGEPNDTHLPEGVVRNCAMAL